MYPDLVMRRSQRNHKFKSPMLVFTENEKNSEPTTDKNCLEHNNSIFDLIELPKTPKLDTVTDVSINFLSPCKY